MLPGPIKAIAPTPLSPPRYVLGAEARCTRVNHPQTNTRTHAHHSSIIVRELGTTAEYQSLALAGAILITFAQQRARNNLMQKLFPVIYNYIAATTKRLQR